MLDQVTAAFERQDYPAVSRLLKQWLQESPQNPWAQFYYGRLQEVTGKLDPAEKLYRQLLRQSPNPKLATQVRQGLGRLEQIRQAQRQQAIAEVMTDPSNSDPGFLILEGVSGGDRSQVIQALARILNRDPYTVRLILPSRGWRLYRSGLLGELTIYGQQLQQAGVPVFWASIPQIEGIPVFQVDYFQEQDGQPVAICQDSQTQRGAIAFDWTDVQQRVEGILPIFEQVLDTGRRNQLERKEEIQDYSHLCDLHLFQRNCILRLHDSTYNFQRGVGLAPQPATHRLDRQVLRTNWNSLLGFLTRQMPGAIVHSDFSPFGESAADFAMPLTHLKSYLDILRSHPTYWDPAFHLYSGLHFLKARMVAEV